MANKNTADSSDIINIELPFVIMRENINEEEFYELQEELENKLGFQDIFRMIVGVFATVLLVASVVGDILYSIIISVILMVVIYALAQAFMKSAAPIKQQNMQKRLKELQQSPIVPFMKIDNQSLTVYNTRGKVVYTCQMRQLFRIYIRPLTNTRTEKVLFARRKWRLFADYCLMLEHEKGSKYYFEHNDRRYDFECDIDKYQAEWVGVANAIIKMLKKDPEATLFSLERAKLSAMKDGK